VKCLDLGDQDQIGADMWEYQSCTEMVMPMCFKGGKNDMFEPQSWNLTAVEKDCQTNWKVTPLPEMEDIQYGSKKLQAASNIVFSNGLKDPWSSGGITKKISDSVLAVIIPEGAHHLDLRGSNPLDPKSVIDARNVHRENIGKWINRASVEPTARNIVQVTLENDAMDNVKIEVLP
jgi:lysosomal Pro-X carboxypeptidase